MRYSREELKRAADNLLGCLTGDDILDLKTFGGLAFSSAFCTNEYIHMEGYIRSIFAKTGKVLEADYCFVISVHMVWSRVLQEPIVIHIQEHEAKTYNRKKLC